METLEALDILKSLVLSLSYLTVISRFFAVNKKYNCVLYFGAIFAVNVIFTIYGWEVYANYIYLAVTSLFISTIHGYMKGFSFALTIFAAFQWIVAFGGSIAFILFPHERVVDSAAFVAALSCALLGAAWLLRIYSRVIFRLDTSNKLLLIEICSKLFFVGFFNLFFPRYFEILGGRHYSVLALVLLITTVIFAVYREYSVTLEKQLAIHNRDALAVTLWAEQIISKYEEIKHSDHISGHIGAIDNHIVQALLYELIHTSDRLGISVDLSINPTSRINLNNYDLFSIINDFIENSLLEAKAQTDKSIRIVVDSKADSFRFMIQTKTEALRVGTSADFKVKKDNIVGHIKKNANISISYSKSDSFIQILEVS